MHTRSQHIEPRASAAAPETLNLSMHLREGSPVISFNPAERPADTLDTVDVGPDARSPDDPDQQDGAHRTRSATFCDSDNAPIHMPAVFPELGEKFTGVCKFDGSHRIDGFPSSSIFSVFGFHCSTGKIRQSLSHPWTPPASRPIFAGHGACQDF
jgi:hypothetical protein